MYAANLVVNLALIATLALAGWAWAAGAAPLPWLAAGLLAAMVLRLAWLRWRQAAHGAPAPAEAAEPQATAAASWGWAVLAAGLPLALPFAARSIASQSGEGALATFNYAWKLVELPLLLAIQLVATLAFPAITRAAIASDEAVARATRTALALAWCLAAASVVGLVIGAPAVARLLFGWGRMQPQALAELAQWGRIGAWGLLPQALAAVALTVLATRGRMQAVVCAHAAALAVLLWLGAHGWSAGGALMLVLDLVFAGVAAVALLSLGRSAAAMLPWGAIGAGLAMALAAWALQATGAVDALPWLPQLALAVAAAFMTIAAGWWCSADVRQALRR
jgi:peptidoglycan biosynthesis protein MviN/MurJ (putative lipid II flippase)